MLNYIIPIVINFLARLIGRELFAPDSREELLLIPSDNALDGGSAEDPPPKHVSISRKLLSPKNKFSRSGKKLIDVKGIVVHWTARPGADAEDILSYFSKVNRYASTHYVVDAKKIIQLLPESEIGYHVGSRKYRPGIEVEFMQGVRSPNYTTIGIECCHPDWSGKMEPRTLANLESVCIKLMRKHDLSSNDVYLHSDFTGKKCHKFFVDNPKEWDRFKQRTQDKL